MRITSCFVFFLIFALCLTVLMPLQRVQGISPNIVISQVYGGGGNTGATLKNDFIELFNRGTTTVNVTGWSVQYASAAGTTWQVTILSGSIASGQYYLVQQAAGAGGTVNLPTPDATGSIAMSAASAKVALVNNSTALSGSCPSGSNIVDFVGYGTANCFEGSAAAPALSNTTAALRASGGCTDTDNNSADFAAGPPNPRNTATAFNACTASTPPSGVGAATPAILSAGDVALLTVAVTPGTNPASTGLAVMCDLSAIGGSATQSFFDNGTNGDVTPGDNTFSFQATVSPGARLGVKTVPISITDAQSRTGTTNITLTVAQFLPIHDIQGTGTSSPHVSEVVITSGIVTARRSNGFFIQLPDASVDGDPNTSEGILVFTGGTPPAAATVGNLVRVAGTVLEFIPAQDSSSPPITEIAGSPITLVVSTGNPLPARITLTAADTSPTGSIEQLERFEGMRVHVDSLTVVGPTQGSISETNATATSNGVFFGVITGVSRPFREPGIEVPDPLPAGSPCCVPRFDGNPERLRVDSDAQPGAVALEVTAGATVANLTGPLDYAFRTYTILPDPASGPVVSGNIGASALPTPAINEFTVASFNLQRFFDTTNDPGVSDAVLTATAFNNRLSKASLALRTILSSPDIIGVQEVENLTTLQALADKLNSDTLDTGQPNPDYRPYLEEGNDIGGIDVGLLVKRARVSVVDVTQLGKFDTFMDPNTGLPEILNDRPPLILRAIVHSAIGPDLPVTVIVNHLRSLSGIADPTDGNRVRTKRQAQAEFLANLIHSRQTADPNENIISIGDYNAFQFNDGYVDVIGTVKGTPTPADNVVLASSDLVNLDLADLVDAASADERYSFVFSGSAQVLDHILATNNLISRLSQFHYARNDADFPETFRSNPTRPERISDHDVPVAYIMLPPVIVQIDIKPGEFPNSINLGSNGTLAVAIFSSADFDAGTVDPSTVSLASASVRLKGKGTPMSSFEDVNGDGLRDLLVHISADALQLTPNDTQAVLIGGTFDGKRIRGVDTIRIIP